MISLDASAGSFVPSFLLLWRHLSMGRLCDVLFHACPVPLPLSLRHGFKPHLCAGSVRRV
jgi:hypothetical protein